MAAHASLQLLGLAVIVLATASSVTPVQKVIQLLNDMTAQAKEMKNAEAVEYSKFQQFCTDTIANQEKEVAEAAELMETLSAEIGKLESDSTTLGEKIASLQQGVANAESGVAEANAQWEKDQASYKEQIQDYAESVDALERAIAVLSKQNYDRAQTEGAALLQNNGSPQLPALPEQVRRAGIAALLQDAPSDYLTRNGPEAHAYEFQSTSILDLLKKLRDDFDEKRSEAEKEEINTKHAHDMLSQDLHGQIEAMTADSTDKTVLREEKNAQAAEKKKMLQSTTSEHDEATMYLKDLKVECEEKGKSFEEKQGLRAGEIQAIEKAIEILSSAAVSGAAEKHLPGAASLIQNHAISTSLAQLRGDGDPRAATRKALSSFLHSEGTRLNSRSLGMLAERVASAQDPFAKVKQMIDDLITRLLEETNQESEQKGYCDKELGMSKKTRTKLQNTIDSLTADIEETQASIAQMTQHLAALAEELLQLQTSKKEAVELRAAEKAKNEETIKDAREAQTAVADATNVLKEFYDGAKSATALIQVSQEPVKMGSVEWEAMANPNFEGTVDPGHREGMQVFGGKAYQGQQGEAGGVLAMLEVIASDFAGLEASTEAAEATAAAEHKDFVVATDKNIAVDQKESEMLTADKITAESKSASLTRDLKSTQDQLLAADRYYEKLKPTCVDTGLSYEERAKTRQEEIESLQEALRILSGEDLSNAI